ncbi:hypothetical protein BS17DRAFT_238248 [Gyrodon lividus]|nr:hypothetical protein BS17DRAFT_238248 [Gyrodon lividus]
MMQCVKTAQSGTGPPTAVDITTKVPQVSNLRMTQPGAGSSPKVFGLPKPYQSLLPAPRKSMLPAPRKSMLPAPLKRTILASSNTSKVIQSASCPAKESMMAQMQPKQTASLTATCVPLESIVLSGTENEAPALSASSSLAVLDEAVQESRVDIFALMPTLDSMAFLDASFSVSAVPSVFKCRAPLHKGASLYAPAVRKTVAAKPSRRL